MLSTSYSSLIVLPSKRQRAQRNAARAASVEISKERRLEASSLLDDSVPPIQAIMKVNLPGPGFGIKVQIDQFKF